MKKLKRLKQCKHCPWKKSTDPYQIKNYIRENHEDVIVTIATKSPLEQLEDLGSPLPVIACHESHQDYCIGYLHNQLKNNNIRLRIQMMGFANAGQIEVQGEQHSCFQETLPSD